MLDYKPNIVLSDPEENYRVVGTRPVRHDGPDKVMGRARYAADIHLPGMLHGKILRSPYAHARIRGIDASRALALPGVHAVVTGADFPDVSAQINDQEEGAPVNYGFYTRNVMAREKALYLGHAVAAIVADSPHLAEEALALIDVDWEVLPAVLNADEAMAPGAPLVHERLVTLANPAQRSGGWAESDGGDGSNVSNHFQFSLGDLEAGFAEADEIIEREYHTKSVHQGYIEPHSATARWNTDDTVTIWASSQGHFALRDHTSRILGISVGADERCPHGDRWRLRREGSGRLLPRARRRCVGSQGWSPRQDCHDTNRGLHRNRPNFRHAHQGQGWRHSRRSFRRRPGLAGVRSRAFPGSPVPSGCRTMFAPYEIPHGFVEGYDVVTNVQKSSAYRAPGSPAASFAAEQAIDELCEKLGIDPLEFRLNNASKEGSRQVAGPTFRRIGMVEILQATQDHPHLASPVPEPTGPGRSPGAGSPPAHGSMEPAQPAPLPASCPMAPSA